MFSLLVATQSNVDYLRREESLGATNPYILNLTSMMQVMLYDVTDAQLACKRARTGMRIGIFEDKLQDNGYPKGFAFITWPFYHVVT